jgi:GTP-binding protein
MIFGVNTSPFAGRDGQFVTSRQIKDRLDRELIGNVVDSRRADGRPSR